MTERAPETNDDATTTVDCWHCNGHGLVKANFGGEWKVMECGGCRSQGWMYAIAGTEAMKPLTGNDAPCVQLCYCERAKHLAEIARLREAEHTDVAQRNQSLIMEGNLRDEIARLQEAKRTALRIANEKTYENVALRAENEQLRAASFPTLTVGMVTAMLAAVEEHNISLASHRRREIHRMWEAAKSMAPKR